MPIFAMLLLGLPRMAPLDAPVVAPFAHGRKSAFSLEFDDSMVSQIHNVLPLLAQYRFPATFYINPGRNDYDATVWEKQVPAAGHELADHTLHHGDTVGAEQGAKEIGSVAKIIERVYGGPRLTVFGTPGGVKWEIPEADFRRILAENRLIFPGRQDFYQDGQGDITRFPQRALNESIWRQLGMHGVGGQWLSTSVANLAKLLQYLDVHRDEIWVAPTGTVWKYVHEREALLGLTTTEVGEGSFAVTMHFRPTLPAPFELYDVPLTVHAPVPAGWTKAWVRANGVRRAVPVTDGAIEFDVRPQEGPVVIERG